MRSGISGTSGISGVLGFAGTRMGRYRLSRRLGEGGMAEVFLGYDEEMCRAVAVKVVDSREFEFVLRFQREIETIGSLAHEHILPVFDYGEQGEWRYLVMQYVAGGTLRERLQNGPLAPGEAGHILRQVASALQCAHARGIIHRDIKPSNILLRGDYAYLADFGLARELDKASSLTKTGSLLGTPEYMAPELAHEEVSASVDIYALGVVLYQMLTGRVPFSGNSVLSIYWKHLQEAPVPPSRLNPTLPPAVDAVVLRALAKDPRQRFQTADALARAYDLALEAVPRTLSTVNTQELTWPLHRLRLPGGFVLTFSLALVFLLLSSLSLALNFFNGLSREQHAPAGRAIIEFTPAHLPTDIPSELKTPTAKKHPTKVIPLPTAQPTHQPKPITTPPLKPTPTPTLTPTPPLAPTPTATPPGHRRRHRYS